MRCRRNFTSGSGASAGASRSLIWQRNALASALSSDGQAALNELLDDEASKVRILDYLRKWRGNELETNAS